MTTQFQILKVYFKSAKNNNLVLRLLYILDKLNVVVVK